MTLDLSKFDLSRIDRAALLRDLDRADCEESLYEFLKHAWRWIDGAPFVDGWCIGAICEHLQAVVYGQITRLIINQPPRTLKSTLVSICLPAFIWAQRDRGPISGPQVPMVYSSYALDLAIRDSRKCRQLIESPWYRALWGDRFSLTGDQNVKSRYANDQKGERMTTAVDAKTTGEGGMLWVVDDGNSAKEVLSPAMVAATNEWWDGSVSTRLNDPRTGAFINVQQRVGEDDLTGHILDTDPGIWTHLMLAMRHEKDRSFTTSIGWVDPREEGELLWPERFDEDIVAGLERSLGPFRASGQLQQSPEPKGGGIVKRDWWRLYQQLDESGNPKPNLTYPSVELVVAALDTAYTEKEENDPSAMTTWGVFSGADATSTERYVGRDGKAMSTSEQSASFSTGSEAPAVMMMHAWQARLELHDLVTKVAETCKSMRVDRLLIEDKAAGHSVAQELRRLYAGASFAVQLVPPKGGDKVARLYSVQHLFAEGLVWAPDKTWAEMVISQVASFPKGKHDDLVDTVSMALQHLRRIGILVRAPEWAAEVAQSMQHRSPERPLYDV